MVVCSTEVKALYVYTDAQWNSCENQFCIDETALSVES